MTNASPTLELPQITDEEMLAECEQTLADDCVEPLTSRNYVKWASRAQILARALKAKLTPSQSDVEAARDRVTADLMDMLQSHYEPEDACEKAQAYSRNVVPSKLWKILDPYFASLIAARGTRALTPRMKAAVSLARNLSGENFDALLIADLLKAIDRLTGEAST